MARIVSISVREDIARRLEEISGKNLKDAIKDAIEFFVLFYEPAKEYIKKKIEDGDRSK